MLANFRGAALIGLVVVWSLAVFSLWEATSAEIVSIPEEVESVSIPSAPWASESSSPSTSSAPSISAPTGPSLSASASVSGSVATPSISASLVLSSSSSSSTGTWRGLVSDLVSRHGALAAQAAARVGPPPTYLGTTGAVAAAWFQPVTLPHPCGPSGDAALAAWAGVLRFAALMASSPTGPRTVGDAAAAAAEDTRDDGVPLHDAAAARIAMLGIAALRLTCGELLATSARSRRTAMQEGGGGLKTRLREQQQEAGVRVPAHSSRARRRLQQQPAANASAADLASLGLRVTALALEGWVRAAAAALALLPSNLSAAMGDADHPLHPELRRGLAKFGLLAPRQPSLVNAGAQGSSAFRGAFPAEVDAALSSIAAHALWTDAALEAAVQPARTLASGVRLPAECTRRVIMHGSGEEPAQGKPFVTMKPLGPWESDWVEELVPEQLEWRRLTSDVGLLSATPLSVLSDPALPIQCAAPGRNITPSAPLVFIPLFPKDWVAGKGVEATVIRLHAARVAWGAIHLSDEDLNADVGWYNGVGWVARQYWRPAIGAGATSLTSNQHVDHRGKPLRVLVVALGYKTGFWSEGAAGTAQLSALARDAIRRRPLALRPLVWLWVGNKDKVARGPPIDALVQAGLGNYSVHNADGFAAKDRHRHLQANATRERISSAMFTVCLWGNINEDTFRFSETLDAGALPIVRSEGGGVQKGWSQVYWDGVFGADHPLLMCGQLQPDDASGSSCPARMIQALLQPGNRERLEGYHQAVVDWWAVYKWGLRRQLARWMRSDSEG